MLLQADPVAGRLWFCSTLALLCCHPGSQSRNTQTLDQGIPRLWSTHTVLEHDTQETWSKWQPNTTITTIYLIAGEPKEQIVSYIVSFEPSFIMSDMQVLALLCSCDMRLSVTQIRTIKKYKGKRVLPRRENREEENGCQNYHATTTTKIVRGDRAKEITGQWSQKSQGLNFYGKQIQNGDKRKGKMHTRSQLICMDTALNGW